MHPLSWLSKWRRRRENESVMAQEFALHLELLTEENVRRGMAREAAELAARRSFGGVEQVKERCRDARGLVWVAQLRQDIGYAIRSLATHRTFTVTSVLTLAIGIGANTTILGLINDLMFRPTALREGGRIVAVHTRSDAGDHGYRSFSYPEFETLSQAKRLFAQTAAMHIVTTTLGPDDAMQMRMVYAVSSNYFVTLRATPWRGRFFTADECAPSAQARVVVASYELWQRLGSPERFVGSSLRIGRQDYTVIGIAPAEFAGLHWSIGPEAWLPLGSVGPLRGAPAGTNLLLDPHAYVLSIFAELNPDVSFEQGQAALAPWAARINEQNGTTVTGRRSLSISIPSRANLDLSWPMDESQLGTYGIVAAVITLLVLVIASFNVAHMLFARGVARRKEIAIRLCLGASRARVIRQLLVEGLVLAFLGGCAGVLCDRFTYGLLLSSARLHTGSFALHLQNHSDWRLLAAAAGLSLFATVCFALVPALRATRMNLADDLKRIGGAPARAGGFARFFTIRQCLVMTQIALSVVLLFVTVILVRAVRTTEQERGFELKNRVVANLNYDLARTPPALAVAEQKRVLAEVRALPGVRNAALASVMPYNFEASWIRVFAAGSDALLPKPEGATDNGHGAIGTFVTDEYFDAMGIPIRRGRAFTAAESLTGGARPVAIIDETLARALYGDTDPIGRRLALSAADRDSKTGDRLVEIVGIVRSPREDAIWGVAMARIYRPMAQAQSTLMSVYIPVELADGASAATALSAIRRVARTIDPRVPMLRAEPLDEFVNGNLNTYTVHTLEGLFATFGLVSCVLAVVGVYGVKAHSVARRTQEIGIRIAIGARSGDVIRLLLHQSVWQTVLGVAAGAGGAIALGVVLAHLVYKVQPFEPGALALAALPVTLVAMVACLIPAYRATRIDPTIALRAE